MSFLQLYLPLYFIAYLTLAFIWPSYRTYRQTDINPITFGKTDNAHDYIGRVMKLLIVLLMVSIIIFSFIPSWYAYLGPLTVLEQAACFYTGLILMHLSLIWIAVAQYQMNKSWRIGIDEVHKTELITRGLFRYSRNPIFLGMIVSVAGVFLVLPNTLTFCILFSTYFIIHIQIRLEEAFLVQQHPEAYKQYKTHTRRIL